MATRIAAVIVTFNRRGELSKTLRALAQEGVPEHSTYVVNNHSRDGTAEMLADQFPGVRAFNLPENIASAGGFAHGMQAAHRDGHEWVWLFNDDSRPTAGALDSLLRVIDEPQWSLLGLLKIANLDPTGRAIVLDWQGVRVNRLVAISEVPVESDLITFDGCLVSSRLMSSIGYCDPAFFMGIYEFEYCLRATRAGFAIATIPNGRIDDGKLGSESGSPPWRQYYNTRNHLWLGLSQRSPTTIAAWARREAKFTAAILAGGTDKTERIAFKAAAVVDAVLGRRGKRFDPEVYGGPQRKRLSEEIKARTVSRLRALASLFTGSAR